MTRITGIRTHDLRFPTSDMLDGSDAMNPDPDYSAAYVILETDGAYEGHGLTFTLGRGYRDLRRRNQVFISFGCWARTGLDSRRYGAVLASHYGRQSIALGGP